MYYVNYRHTYTKHIDFFVCSIASNSWNSWNIPYRLLFLDTTVAVSKSKLLMIGALVRIYPEAWQQQFFGKAMCVAGLTWNTGVSVCAKQKMYLNIFWIDIIVCVNSINTLWLKHDAKMQSFAYWVFHWDHRGMAMPPKGGGFSIWKSIRPFFFHFFGYV